MPVPTVTPISPIFSITGQLTPADFETVARAGYRSVINNRPDHEGGAEQPESSALERAAAQRGLAYAHQPVEFSKIGPADVERFAELVERLPKPILAFCRTGARSRKLFEAAAPGEDAGDR